MPSAAEELAGWASDLVPVAEDVALADRALVDTISVALACREDGFGQVAAHLPTAGRWSAMAHLLDYDDLHLPSTTHISAVCVPSVLAVGGDARAYLAGAGVMARLGSMLGWPHYRRGWHATCTAGAPGAAVAAAVAMNLNVEQIASAICLAVPAAGGVQRAFGSAQKSLQVGFAAAAGVRAAKLASVGVRADFGILDQWLHLVGARSKKVDIAGPAIPGGLAMKAFPCCYALQRPISAVIYLLKSIEEPFSVKSVRIKSPESGVKPLIHARPRTGLEGKFSLQYGVAAALLDGYPGQQSFTTESVSRKSAQELMERITVSVTPGGDGLLAGCLELELVTGERNRYSTSLEVPPGAPQRPLDALQVQDKVRKCLGGLPGWGSELSWQAAAEVLSEVFPGRAEDETARTIAGKEKTLASIG